MMIFTPAQQAAISCDAPEILVSAAAGSGKTAVLTARILRHISNNIGIDRLLIVTFTEAAAAEMKERVTDKIHEMQLESPSLHLANQAALLAVADISTIHSFCRKLIKEHFQMVDIDPAFRVADESELSIIKSQVMDELFEVEYEKDDNSAFLDLADVYGGKAKDDRLDSLVRRLYAFLESDPFPLEAARRYADRFNPYQELDDTPWVKLIKKELAAGLDGIVEGLKLAIDVCRHPDGPEKYIDKIDENISSIKHLKKIIEKKPFAEMYNAFAAMDWGRLPSIREKDMVNAALKERAQRIRDREAKNRLKDMINGVFFASAGKMQAELAALAPRVKALMALVSSYAEAFAAEKRRRNVLDFSDLEHFAIKILYPDGPDDMTPGPVAVALQEKYHEVLVDEYQDSNKVQDLILSPVAKQRFMVGDVKQSIYRFRRANPGLFLEKYDRFKKVDPLAIPPDAAPLSSHQLDPLRIDLSQNFRSRDGVIDAVNFFFSQLMCSDVGEINYDQAAALYVGADYPPLPEASFTGTWVEILDQSTTNDSELNEIEEDSPSAIIAETRMIAACIHELISQRQVWDSKKEEYRKCELGDIVILARSANSLAEDVVEELKNCGIDAIADMTASFYQQIEVKTVLSFLRITDNPRQDIDLIAALYSPTYGLTPDELLMIRRCLVSEEETSKNTGEDKKKKPHDLYDHLKAFQLTNASEETLQKTRRFLSDLEIWRGAAISLPISRLMGLIFDTTNYPSHAAAMPGGDIRLANLQLLLEKAIEFEETSFKGLFHFISYVERLYDTEGATRVSGAAAPSKDMANRVRFMSIHKSKGLEFPIVITSFLGKTFNLDDERQPIILHGKEGLGPKYVNLKKRTRSKTLAHYGLARLTRRENLSEELRCLYVAMTRAKELCILTGRTADLSKDIEKWADAAAAPGQMPSVYYRQSAAKFLDWIMPCLLRHKDAAALVDDDYLPPKNIYDHLAGFDIRVHHGQMMFETPIIEKEPDINETEILVNPHAPTFVLPSKLAISEIKRLYASDVSYDSTPHVDSPPTFDAPQFIQSNVGVTQMQLGSAMHAIVEHMDFHKHTTKETISQLVFQLIEKNLLTEEASKVIDYRKIETLANSKIANRIRAASNVYRETPFVMAIPAAELYPEIAAGISNGYDAEMNTQSETSHENNISSQETILVHGIVDCYFEENGQLVIIDFKNENPTRGDIEAWINSHRVQLNIYKKAIEAATEKNVKEILLYSFSQGLAIKV